MTPQHSNRLDHERRAAGLSQERLAELCGLSVRSIRGIERGSVRRPHRSSIELLASALELSATAREEFLQSFLESRSGTDHGPLPAELPRDLADFVGRRADVIACIEHLRGAAEPRPPLTVIGISGPGGFGKTSLAVHIGHRVSASFPSGQIFLTLAVSGRGGLTVEDATVEVLRSMGTPPSRIPSTHDGRVRMIRSLGSQGRYLVVIDNPAPAERVEDLFPGDGASAVIVTSRAPRPEMGPLLDIRLHEHPTSDAVALLRSAAGRRPENEDTATDNDWIALADLCGRSSLALRIAGSRLAARPDWEPSHLVERMRPSDRRLGELEYGSLSIAQTLASAFAALYRKPSRVGLNPALAMLTLAQLPCADFTVETAADALGATPFEADGVADQLLAAQLISVGDSGRFRFHDLIREFAVWRASRQLSAEERALPVLRLGDLLSTRLAQAATYGLVRRLPDAPPEDPPQDWDSAALTRWIDAEYMTMRDYIDASARGGASELARSMPIAWRMRELAQAREDVVTLESIATSIRDAALRLDLPSELAWAQIQLINVASLRTCWESLNW